MGRLLGKQHIRDLCLALGLLCAALALVLWPGEAMSAMKDGLSLCGNVILPSLFPFFVLSSLVVELGMSRCLGRLFQPVMAPLFRVNGACASAVALGFIGGYPVGARTAIALYESGQCSRTEAERLLAFCNNSGPAFILGVVGAGVFASSKVGLLLYLAHAAASVCVGLLFRFYGRERGGRERRASPTFGAERITAAFTGAVKNAFLSTLNICAFVVFFTVVIKLLFLSGLLPGLAGALGALLSPLGFSTRWAERLLTGLIELTSGVWTLTGAGTMSGKLSMAAFLLGWAGLSVHCQVLSFIGGSGLSVRTYIGGKLLHGGLSALFIGLLLRFFPLEEPVAAYLAEQVEGIAGVDFSSALTISLAAAWIMWLLFFLSAAAAVGKTSRKRRRGVV